MFEEAGEIEFRDGTQRSQTISCNKESEWRLERSGCVYCRVV